MQYEDEKFSGRFDEFFDIENQPEFGDMRKALREAVNALEAIAGASWGVRADGVSMTAKSLTIDRARAALGWPPSKQTV